MKGKKLLWLAASVAIILAVVLALRFIPRTSEAQKAFLDKANLLKAEVVTDGTVEALGESPVDGLGHVVFLSVCDGTARAEVVSGKGKTLSDAWDDAVKRAVKKMNDHSMEPRWLRADVVDSAWPATALDVLNEIKDTPSGFDYNGLAIDPQFKAALVEGQMNGMGLYDYKENRVDVNRLNDWMDKTPCKCFPTT